MDFERYLADGERLRGNIAALIRLVPPTALEWQPTPSTMTMRALIRHLTGVADARALALALMGQAGAMVVRGEPATASSPAQLAAMYEHVASGGLERLRNIPRDRVQSALAGPATLPWGAPSTVEGLAWATFEHEVHHRTQLFLYLKMLGVPVDTQTLWPRDPSASTDVPALAIGMPTHLRVARAPNG